MHGDLDHVVGILRLKDFVVNAGKGKFVIDDLMTKPLYFHENMNVYKVLEALIDEIDDEIEDEPENCLVEGIPASVKKRIDQ